MSKFKRFTFFVTMIISFIFVLTSCEKDEDTNTPSNPTNPITTQTLNATVIFCTDVQYDPLCTEFTLIVGADVALYKSAEDRNSNTGAINETTDSNGEASFGGLTEQKYYIRVNPANGAARNFEETIPVGGIVNVEFRFF